MDNARVPSSSSDFADIAGLMAKGEWVLAKLRVETLLEKQSENAEAWKLKAEIHKHLADFATTVACLNQALKLSPDDDTICYDLAEILEAAGQIPLAIKMYERWLNIIQTGAKPVSVAMHVDQARDMDIWFEKGNTLLAKREFAAAAVAFEKVLHIFPDTPGALRNLGIARYQQGDAKKAIEPLLQSIRLKPDNFESLNALGICYTMLNQHPRAIAAYRQAVAVNPNFALGWFNIGKSYFILKHYADAIHGYRQTLALEPENVEALTELLHLFCYLCQWEEAAGIKSRIRALFAKGGSGEPFIITAHLPDIQLENARRSSTRVYPWAKPYDPNFALPADMRNDGKLRIGYLSSDLQQHATTALMAQMLEQHDRSRFEIYAYSYGADDNSTERKRIVAAVDTFRDVRMLNDPDAAALIKSDGIDLLLELKGYTQGTRIGIATHRPAPIAIHYLGYPGSTGSPCIDYFISDPVSSPPGSESQFTEKLIRLPHTYQINDRTRTLPRAALPRHTYGLPPEGFVFCAFNNGYKITPEMFAVWMRILKATEGSVLWLHQTHPDVTTNLKREAEKHGIDPARLVMAPAIAVNQHLMRYFYADVFLDTAPVCGHTTASDALWCGVPVITLPSEPFISRVAASLLAAVDLPQLAVHSLEEYEDLALSLYRDREKLAKLKRHLDDGRMQFPLFDCVATTRAMEASYLHAAELHRQGQAPRGFSLTPDFTLV
jgi:protein O-GlcNAc transferase